jgi:glycosyltransferase involved in cell wall biosynthesis
VRVLITVPWGERLGGAEMMLQTLLDGGSSPEHELELVFLEDGSWPHELERAGFHVEVIEAGRLRQPWRMVRCVLALAATLRRRRPDLVVNWMPKAHLYCAPAAALARIGGRVVWWQHEIPSDHWMDRLATLLPARAVGCCSRAAAEAQERLRPHRSTFVVAPGVAPPAPAALPGNDGELPAEPGDGLPVVGLVGRLQPWKGQDRLLRAQVLLRERGHPVRTLIVGGDAHRLSSDYAAALPGLVGELGLTGAVTLTGQVADAGPYIEQMDLLVNASDPEPFGLVLLEAMARGVAVVAVGSGGPAEIVQDGRTGVLAPTGDPEALADAIERALSDPVRLRELGEAGRLRFSEHYTDRAMRYRLLSRLEQLARVAAPR